MLVFDLETDKQLDRRNRDSIKDLRITVACFIEDDGKCHNFMFLDASIIENLEKIKALMDSADRICAYNGRGFDFWVLLNYFDQESIERWLAKLVDPFEIIRFKTGSWVKLNELCVANGLSAKSGDGLLAISWWKNGEYDKVAQYCEQDTRLLWRLIQLDHLLFPIKKYDFETREHVVVEWKKLHWKKYLARSNT